MAARPNDLAVRWRGCSRATRTSSRSATVPWRISSSMGLTSHAPGSSRAGAIGITIPFLPTPTVASLRHTEEIASKSAEDIRELIRYSTPGKIAAFIAERFRESVARRTGSKLSERGIQDHSDHGRLCIADEVQTRFGRTGDHYWGFRELRRHSDFVTMQRANRQRCAASGQSTTANGDRTGTNSGASTSIRLAEIRSAWLPGSP